MAFSPVKSDILGNVKVHSDSIQLSSSLLGNWKLIVFQKLRDRQLAAPAESENIQDLCRNELKTKKHTATEGLLWLVRCVSPTKRLNPPPVSDTQSEEAETNRNITVALNSPASHSAPTLPSPPKNSPTLSAAPTARPLSLTIASSLSLSSALP